MLSSIQQKFWKRKPSLEALATHYGTDKGAGTHNFIRRYVNHFEPFQHEEFNLLEIGVYNGASLRMWEAYFSKANIAAIDIDPKCEMHGSLRAKVFSGDQSDKSFLQNLERERGPFKIVIDDGSHVESHQRATFVELFPLVLSGGLYVIEDLHTSYWADYNPVGIVEFLKTLIDDVNMRGKSGYGDIKNDPDCEKIRKTLSFSETHVAAIHMYKSIVFIERA